MKESTKVKNTEFLGVAGEHRFIFTVTWITAYDGEKMLAVNGITVFFFPPNALQQHSYLTL